MHRPESTMRHFYQSGITGTTVDPDTRSLCSLPRDDKVYGSGDARNAGSIFGDNPMSDTTTVAAFVLSKSRRTVVSRAASNSRLPQPSQKSKTNGITSVCGKSDLELSSPGALIDSTIQRR